MRRAHQAQWDAGRVAVCPFCQRHWTGNLGPIGGWPLPAALAAAGVGWPPVLPLFLGRMETGSKEVLGLQASLCVSVFVPHTLCAPARILQVRALERNS